MFKMARSAGNFSVYNTKLRKKLQMARSAEIFTLISMKFCKKSWNLQLKEKVGKKFIKNRENSYEFQEHLTVYHYFFPTEFLPCFFPSWIYSPPKIFALGKLGVQIKKYTCVTSHIIVLDVPFMHHMVWSRHAQINFTTVNYQSFETPLVASICANVSDMSKE